MNRLDFIDPALKTAGWGETEGSRIRVKSPITEGRLIGQGRRKQPPKSIREAFIGFQEHLYLGKEA